MTKKPQILVYIGDDNPTRGDSHGFKGIGTELAATLEGGFHYVEKRLLNDLYPIPRDEHRTERIRRSNQLMRYFQARGFPDIALGSDLGDVRNAMFGMKMPYTRESINEDLAETYLDPNQPVAHHLTPELLKEEGKKFRAAYPNLPSPLIAVIFDEMIVSSLVGKLVSVCSTYPETTVFLCGSRNTTIENYADATTAFEDERRKQGLEGRLKLEGYNFKFWQGKRRVYNPYIGLLNEADHVVVRSISRSLISEPSAAGKRIIYFGSSYLGLSDEMEKMGLALHFNRCTYKAPFENSRIAPVSTARDIAQKIAVQYKALRTPS